MRSDPSAAAAMRDRALQEYLQRKQEFQSRRRSHEAEREARARAAREEAERKAQERAAKIAEFEARREERSVEPPAASAPDTRLESDAEAAVAAVERLVDEGPAVNLRSAGGDPDEVLASIGGVGPAKRKALVEHFGSLEGIAAASVEDLVEVPGIGLRLAVKIAKALR